GRSRSSVAQLGDHWVLGQQVREQIRDLGAMREIVIEHAARYLGETNDADALLVAATLPLNRGDRAQLGDVARARRGEGGNRLVQWQRQILPLRRHLLAVEIRQERIVLRNESLDARTESFPLEIREVPAVLDE